jgi:hypothetical protein
MVFLTLFFVTRQEISWSATTQTIVAKQLTLTICNNKKTTM